MNRPMIPRGYLIMYYDNLPERIWCKAERRAKRCRRALLPANGSRNYSTNPGRRVTGEV